MSDDFDPVTEEDVLVIESIVYNDQPSYEDDSHSLSLETYMRQLSKFPVLSKDQELSLTRNLKKSREVIYLAFLEDTDCRKEIVDMLTSKVGKIRRIFDHVAKSVDDDAEVMNLKEKLRLAVINNEFSKKDHKHFKNLVIPFNDFYRLVNTLKRKPLTVGVSAALKSYSDTKKTLSECNLRLVFSRAKRFMNRGMTIEDLIQEGNVGLLKAIEKYDPEKGNKFGTYATWWIDQAFGRALADKSKLVRIPVHMVDSMNKVNKALQNLTTELNREPTDKELSELTGLTLDKVKKVRESVVLKMKYLQEFQKEGEKSLPKIMDLHDVSLNPEEALEAKELHGKIREFLASLSPEDEKILRLRFGIGEQKIHDLSEVAKTLRTTRQRVSEIINKGKMDWDF